MQISFVISNQHSLLFMKIWRGRLVCAIHFYLYKTCSISCPLYKSLEACPILFFICMLGIVIEYGLAVINDHFNGFDVTGRPNLSKESDLFFKNPFKLSEPESYRSSESFQTTAQLFFFRMSWAVCHEYLTIPWPHAKTLSKLFLRKSIVRASEGYPLPQSVSLEGFKLSSISSRTVFAQIDATLTIGKSESAFLATTNSICGKSLLIIDWYTAGVPTVSIQA